MKLKKIPIFLISTYAIIVSANAETTTDPKKAVHNHHHEQHEEPPIKMPKEYIDYNFITLKAGLINPTPLDGNSGLNVGNDTYTLGLSVARKYEDRFALELEYMFRGKNTSKSYDATPDYSNTYWSASSNTIMVNASADLLDKSKFTPYLKAGLGVSLNKAYDYVYTEVDQNGSITTQTYAGKKQNSFAWQVGAGVNMKTTEMFYTQLQYMFVDRGQIKTKANYTQSANGEVQNSSPRTGKLREHVITIGITTKF